MLSTDLTSRKICEVLKRKGFDCRLNIFRESEPELATVWICNSEMWWMVEGVWSVQDDTNDKELCNCDIQFKAQILFMDRAGCELVISRVNRLLIGVKTYLCGEKDFLRPVPLLIVHTIPLIYDDEIDTELIVKQFYQFKAAVCQSIGCEEGSPT